LILLKLLLSIWKKIFCSFNLIYLNLMIAVLW